jgi:hypothetical protein
MTHIYYSKEIPKIGPHIYMNIHFLNKTAKFFNGPSINHNKDAKNYRLPGACNRSSGYYAYIRY